MTNGYVTADPAAWASALDELRAARTAYEALTKPDFRDATDRLGRAEEALLDLHAPDLSAVIEKLTVIFDEDMCDETDEARRKRTVIGDLRRIVALQA